MRFSLKTLKQLNGLKIGRTTRSVIMDVWPRAQTYGQNVIGELHFYQPSYSSCCNTPIKTNIFTRQNLFHRSNQQRFSIMVFNETQNP
jgi:hypothetical protein